ncbi:MAG: tRNA pseudouridine(13) synthase TruD [Archangiaceae bacterium]|nr:tRNA pseudouridine(13) synthase TruD [Archangiaceae bacterium]
MRLKQRPEDFSVKESFRFDEVPSGSHRVYLMDKQKLSTFDALARIRDRFGLKPMSISYCGLKDKQGRTEQLIAVNGADVDMQDEDLRLKFLGRTDRPLSAANITSNRFSVTVRAVKHAELPQVNLAAAEVNRLGVVNYFDDQRFGSLKHGQGFIAKDLLRGDFEAALKNFMAVPSPLDRTDDAKVKAFWAKNWGDWGARVPFEGGKKYHRIIASLRAKPRDFVAAFLQIDSDYRAMQLFTFQSYLWNEGVRRLLQLMLPREHLFPMPYQAGTLLFHRDAAPEVLHKLRTLSFPLLSPQTTFEDEQVREAAIWALGKDKLTLDKLTIAGTEKLLYFKHELRPLLVYPHKLVLGRPGPDEMNKPHLKLNVAFTLPPGSYATLVVKRLFHFSVSDDRHLTASEQYERERFTRNERTPMGEGGDRPQRPDGDRPRFDKSARPGFARGDRPQRPDGDRPRFDKSARPGFARGDRPQRPDGDRPRFDKGARPGFARGDRPQRPDGDRPVPRPSAPTQLAPGSARVPRASTRPRARACAATALRSRRRESRATARCPRFRPARAAATAASCRPTRRRARPTARAAPPPSGAASRRRAASAPGAPSGRSSLATERTFGGNKPRNADGGWPYVEA